MKIYFSLDEITWIYFEFRHRENSTMIDKSHRMLVNVVSYNMHSN